MHSSLHRLEFLKTSPPDLSKKSLPPRSGDQATGDASGCSRLPGHLVRGSASMHRKPASAQGGRSTFAIQEKRRLCPTAAATCIYRRPCRLWQIWPSRRTPYRRGEWPTAGERPGRHAEEIGGKTTGDGAQTRKSRDFHRGKPGLSSSEAPPGFEPGVRILQTLALPLGDGAKKRRAF